MGVKPMPLQSKLFRGDSKLEAAAVSDPAHILPGAAGGHVAKIQKALQLLDAAEIAAGELGASRYGGSTAGAVLNFKRKRDIVARPRQSQADNIVGKMTMAALDREMYARETAPVMPVYMTAYPLRIVNGEEQRAQKQLAIRGSRTVNRGHLLAFNQAAPPVIIHKFFLVERKVREEADFVVTNGVGRGISCVDRTIGLVFDPTKPAVFHEGNGPKVYTASASPQRFRVRAIQVGETMIAALDGEGRPVPGNSILLRVTSGAGLKLVSSEGTPLKPKGTGRKICIWGERESAGFDDYATETVHQGYTKDGKRTVRPLTGDPVRPPGLKDKSASDIAVRSAPVSFPPVTMQEIRRIAGKGCRITWAGFPGYGSETEMGALKREFSEARIVEEGNTGIYVALVLELP